MKTLICLFGALLLQTAAAREIPIRADAELSTSKRITPSGWFENPSFCPLQFNLYDEVFYGTVPSVLPIPTDCGRSGPEPQPPPVWPPRTPNVWTPQTPNVWTPQIGPVYQPQAVWPFKRDADTEEERGNDRAKRITGGEISWNGQWPWQVIIGSKSGGPACGGSLIADRWVLTAAHCFHSNIPNPYFPGPSVMSSIAPCNWKARVGEYQQSVLTESSHDDINFEKVIVHPQHDPATLANDVALIKLARGAGVSYNNDVGVICLPRGSDSSASVSGSCMTSGFGRITSKFVQDIFGIGGPPDKMKHVQMTYIDGQQCREELQAKFWYESVFLLKTDQMLCAKSGLGSGFCHGDSGGPLVCEQNDGHYVQVGIVSWAPDTGNCGSTYPQVFVKVSHYIDWIESVVSRNRLN